MWQSWHCHMLCGPQHDTLFTQYVFSDNSWMRKKDSLVSSAHGVWVALREFASGLAHTHFYYPISLDIIAGSRHTYNPHPFYEVGHRLAEDARSNVLTEVFLLLFLLLAVLLDASEVLVVILVSLAILRRASESPSAKMGQSWELRRT